MVKLNEEDRRQAKAEETAKKEEKPAASSKAEDAASSGRGETGPIKTNATIEDLSVVYFPLVTEKAVNMIDAENKITFIVADKAGKKEVKKVVEGAYRVKVDKINMVRDRKGRKKAIVKLQKGYKAEELATKLGVL